MATMAEVDAGLTRDEYYAILADCRPTTTRGGRQYLRDSIGRLWEVTAEETVYESPEWEWAARNKHSRQAILTARRLTWTGLGSYLVGEPQYFAHDLHNTRWAGEEPHNVVRGPYPSRDGADKALDA